MVEINLIQLLSDEECIKVLPRKRTEMFKSLFKRKEAVQIHHCGALVFKQWGCVNRSLSWLCGIHFLDQMLRIWITISVKVVSKNWNHSLIWPVVPEPWVIGQLVKIYKMCVALHLKKASKMQLAWKWSAIYLRKAASFRVEFHYNFYKKRKIGLHSEKIAHK